MQIENHKEEVPFAFYQERFAGMDPAEAARRVGEAFDGAAFTVKLLGTAYRITHPDARVTPACPLPVQTFLLRYLLECRETPWQGAWKTFREMPWGEMYSKPYTGRVLTRAAFSFGTRLEAFRRAGERLGGLPLRHGDAGFEFTLIGDFRMRLQVWAGDEEFPPNAQVLYSDNFEAAFAPEDRVVAGDILISALKAAM